MLTSNPVNPAAHKPGREESNVQNRYDFHKIRQSKEITCVQEFRHGRFIARPPLVFATVRKL
jgi:hypothetical protein